LLNSRPIGPRSSPKSRCRPGWNVQAWIQIIQYSISLAEFIAGFFAGVPKELKTAEAVQRLRESGLWQFQALANDLEIWVRNGVPLSTGNPALRAQLTAWIAGTLRGSGLGLTENQILVLDTVLWRVLASQTAYSGNVLDKVIAAFQQANKQPSPPPGPGPHHIPPPPPPPPPPIRGGGGGQRIGPLTTAVPAPLRPFASQPTDPRAPRRPPTGPIGQPLPGFPSTLPTGQPGSTPSESPLPVNGCQSDSLEGWLSCLRQRVRISVYEEVAACVAIAFASPDLAEKCLLAVLGRQVEEGVKNILRNIRLYLRGQIGKPPPGPLPVIEPQPGLAPLLDTTTPCETCDGGRKSKEIRELKQEIETETQQLQTVTLDQVQEQIDQLKQLETQPASQRDIQSELRQKQELLQQLEQLQQGGGGGQPDIIPPGGQPEAVPPPPGSTVESLCPPGTHSVAREDDPSHRVCVQDTQTGPERSVKFCVGCKTAEDAVLFLNGEPAACSVVPGTYAEGAM
jgi:hypothetical protein